MFKAQWLAAVTVALGAISVAAPQATAQQLQSGDRIRVKTVSAGGDQLIGIYQGSEAEHLVLLLSESARMEVPWKDINRVQVSRGSGSNAGKGAAIGGGVGAALGLAAGLVVAADNSGFFDDVGPEDVIGSTVFMGAIGAGVGALIGLAARSEKWDTVARQQWQIQVEPDMKGGVTVGANLRL